MLHLLDGKPRTHTIFKLKVDSMQASTCLFLYMHKLHFQYSYHHRYNVLVLECEHWTNNLLILFFGLLSGVPGDSDQPTLRLTCGSSTFAWIVIPSPYKLGSLQVAAIKYAP